MPGRGLPVCHVKSKSIQLLRRQEVTNGHTGIQCDNLGILGSRFFGKLTRCRDQLAEAQLDTLIMPTYTMKVYTRQITCAGLLQDMEVWLIDCVQFVKIVCERLRMVYIPIITCFTS